MSDEENNRNDSGTEENDDDASSASKSEEEKEKSASPRPSKSRSSRLDGPPPTKLYVGNLPEDCKRSELSALFEKYGKLEKCDVLRSFAFVHYEHAEDALKAVQKLDDSQFMGVHIQVQHAKSKGKPNAGENECFECGRDGHWARDCPKRRKHDDRRYMRLPTPRTSNHDSIHRGCNSYRPSDSYGGPENYRGPTYRGADYYSDRYTDRYPDRYTDRYPDRYTDRYP